MSLDQEMLMRIRRTFRDRASALPVESLRTPLLNRRSFVFGTTAAGVAFTQRGVAGQGATPAASPVGDPALQEAFFSLGIASGDPLPDGVVLWTRLAPLPFEPDGGMGEAPVDVLWEVATDERMHRIVQRGAAVAEAAWAHSVHVEVSGLDPATPYWYRFRVGDVESPIGRTLTAPAPGQELSQFRFAFASCQRWDHGLYTAYRDMVKQHPDLIVHLGDYIYEYRIGSREFLREGEFPFVALLEPMNLKGYRNRYALHKLDPDLQEAHRIAPWLVSWDDHEVYNNVFGAVNREDPAARMLLDRRAAAYQAYYEHQPLRASARPKGPDLQLYRRVAFGDLLEFNVLDTRQYRSPQGDGCTDEVRLANGGYCPDSLDPERTLLGSGQKQWLLDGLGQTSSRWSVLAQQVPFARIDNDANPSVQSFGGTEMDKWDGYAAERDEVARAIAGAAQARAFNPVVITGDVHANYVWDLKTEWDDESDASRFGTEFVGTSISSNGDEGLEKDGGFTTVCGEWKGNSHNHLFDNHRGYVMCEVTPDQMRADYRVMSNVTAQDASARTLASFVVEDGRPGAQADQTCVPEG